MSKTSELVTVFHTEGFSVIEEMRRDIILAGKHQESFRKLGVDKQRDDPKYKDLDNIDESGAVTLPDALFLYSLIRELKPAQIVELGTWFGTTAYIMEKAQRDNGTQAAIYTCDKHNVLVRHENSAVKYYNNHSSDFLKKLTKRLSGVDFVFIDARLGRDDIKYLKKICSKDAVIACHDWGWSKGTKNIKDLRVLKKKLYVPETQTIDGHEINNMISVLTGSA